MPTSRVEAFSDGVIAILITIMVLDLKKPVGSDFAALRTQVPILLTYVLSFANLAIYWVNHHHLFQATDRVNGRILWANVILLFWLSLFPFTTSWMGENHFATVPTACYGFAALMAGASYWLLTTLIVAEHGPASRIATALGRDLKGKLSVGLYALAVPFTFVSRWIGLGVYVAVALMWFVPDRRLELSAPGREPDPEAAD